MAKVNWSEAYLKQALSDYHILEVLESSNQSYCHKLRYMQMCTEKLAKCYLSALTGKGRQPNSLERLVKFIQATHNYTELYQSMNFKNRNDYSYYLKKSILPIAKALEDYYPSGQYDRPNTEYPWELNNIITIPEDYYFPSLDEKNPNVAAFRNYLRKCFRFFANQTY